MTISSVMLPAKRQATPLRKKSASPVARSVNLLRRSEILPDSSTKGMTSSDGSDVSI